MKVAINRCYGGFGLSQRAYEKLVEYGVEIERQEDGEYWENWHDPETRSTKSYRGVQLVRVIDELGPAANGDMAQLKVVRVPEDVEYTIEEYDGIEWVAEKHRTWE